MKLDKTVNYLRMNMTYSRKKIIKKLQTQVCVKTKIKNNFSKIFGEKNCILSITPCNV
jgi:uncharacterized protein with ACT and thioredoxin-like domain